MSVAVDYRLISQNLERQLDLTASRGQVKLETENYLENYRSVRSLDDFISNTRVFEYAMRAFGLGDLAFAKGYMRKVLEEGVSDPRSLANRTEDPRIRRFAAVFDFNSFGDLTMTRPSVGQAVVDAYVRQALEENAGTDNEGVRLALYFERMGRNLRNGYEVLADPALSQVVRTALGLPNEFVGADIDRQAAIIEERIDLASLSDPQEMQRFLTRFTALWDAASTVSNPIMSLFGAAGASGPNVSIQLAIQLQSLRLGGF